MMQRDLVTGSVPAPRPRLRGLFHAPAPLPPGAVALADNATWSLEVESGATLVLRAGSAWVTLEGDPEDHLLDAPASFTAPHRGRVALWALSPVRFELEQSAPRRAA